MERIMARDRFMFFPNFKATADKLDDKTRLAFYDAITSYVFDDKEPDDPIIAALLEAIKPSLNKEDGRKNNGGNHNPNGLNQHTNSGQSRSNLVNFGQISSETETETEAETEAETETKKNKVDKSTLKESEDFEIFWESYTPVKASDGYVVAKGSKKVAFEKYQRIIKSGVKPEDILTGLKAYIDFCQKNNRLTCGVPVFLNQERWKDEYSTPTLIAQAPPPRMSFKEMKEYQNNIEIQKILNGEK